MGKKEDWKSVLKADSAVPSGFGGGSWEGTLVDTLNRWVYFYLQSFNATSSIFSTRCSYRV